MTDDLATSNLQKINNLMATVGAEGFDQSIAEQVDRASAAQASGDTREAIAISAGPGLDCVATSVCPPGQVSRHTSSRRSRPA
ncbi:hypothetical protein AS594_34225 [Streptomyces agglomeratus]|uniref:Uncharacterized protein n=1 Tax=Streptomyces agglomeratus TaxID=285458 RepID=A0A1E5PGW3_9ACTN|nr:hypothetical protein AS594_34225 [Streptomyces agglomeratus]